MDDLNRIELVQSGGEWNGILFDNPGTGYPPRLSWTFTFSYELVRRDYGSTTPNLVVDWVPLGASSWRDMTGHRVTGRRFADPIETSAYYFEHHRFDTVDLRVLEQRGPDLHVAASAAGDLDGLGVDPLVAEAWLSFRGIIVRPSELPRTVDAARELLATFTDTTGLIGTRHPDNYFFSPAGAD